MHNSKNSDECVYPCKWNLYQDIEIFCHPRNFHCALPQSVPQETTIFLKFFGSRFILPNLKFLVKGTTHFDFSYYQLLWDSSVWLHVSIVHSFLFLSSKYSIVKIYQKSVTCSLVDEHWTCCFQLWDIVNSIALIILTQVSM